LSIEKKQEKISDFSCRLVKGGNERCAAASRFCLSIIIIQPKRLKDWPGYCVLLDVSLRVEKNCCADSRVLSGARRTTAKTKKNLMYKHIPHIKIHHIITLAAITGLVVIAGNSVHAQTTDALDQAEFPTITAQPVDQAVAVGSNAVLSVQAVNADSYQWLSNGVAIDGQTNSNLTLENVGVNDAGSYSCNVSQSGGDAVPTRAASLNVVVPNLGQPVCVFGLPKISGGTQNPCPGNYAGYVNYTKTISQGWGWAPSGSVHTAADGGGRADTKISYLGEYGDTGCNQTTVTIPNPPFSPVYRFTIFFPNHVPATNYPIVLTGFNP